MDFESNKKYKIVSAAIIIKDNTVLLARRAPGESLEGYWEFPGGKQQEDETIQECLEREIKEELDVEIEANEVYAESIFEYEGGAIKLVGIMSDLKDTNLRLSVHDEVSWVKIESLLTYNLAPADIPIAEKLIAEFTG